MHQRSSNFANVLRATYLFRYHDISSYECRVGCCDPEIMCNTIPLMSKHNPGNFSHLGAIHNFSLSFLHLLQHTGVIPEPRFRRGLVRGKEPHGVQLGHPVSWGGRTAPDHPILLKLKNKHSTLRSLSHCNTVPVTHPQGNMSLTTKYTWCK